MGRDGSPSGLISLTPPVRLWYPQLNLKIYGRSYG
nr:MAG TPA: hypothetical protein [Crassvirales sp.]